MISVVMTTLNSERDLIEVLAPLVPASMEGLVHELVVSDAGSTDATLAVLDEAGARMAEGGLEGAVALAKGPWLLVATPATRLPFEWVGPARRHLDDGGKEPRSLVRPGMFARSEALLVRKDDWIAGRRGGKRLKV